MRTNKSQPFDRLHDFHQVSFKYTPAINGRYLYCGRHPVLKGQNYSLYFVLTACLLVRSTRNTGSAWRYNSTRKVAAVSYLLAAGGKLAASIRERRRQAQWGGGTHGTTTGRELPSIHISSLDARCPIIPTKTPTNNRTNPESARQKNIAKPQTKATSALSSKRLAVGDDLLFLA